MEFFDILLSASFWAAAIRIASPLIFATLGELIHSGTLEAAATVGGPDSLTI